MDNVNTDVPTRLEEFAEDRDNCYISESIEHFEPVSLKYDGEELPSESMYISAIHKTKVSSITDGLFLSFNRRAHRYDSGRMGQYYNER